MKTTEDQESLKIKESGKIVDEARKKSKNEDGLARLFFNLIDKDLSYISKIKRMIWKK